MPKSPKVSNKGGRPPRAPGEKLQRVNLSLRPTMMLGLELLARDLGMSLSQACEHALAASLNSRVLGDKTLLQIAKAASAADEYALDEFSEDDVSSRDGWEKFVTPTEIADFLAESGFWRLHLIPQQLLTAEEKYRCRVYDLARGLRCVLNAKDLRVVIGDAFATSRPAAEVAEELVAAQDAELERRKPKS